MAINIEEYRHYLKDFEMTREQEDCLLRAVAIIMEGCADYLFLCHPASKAEASAIEKDCSAQRDSVVLIKGMVRKRYLEAANDSRYEVEHVQESAKGAGSNLLPRFKS